MAVAAPFVGAATVPVSLARYFTLVYPGPANGILPGVLMDGGMFQMARMLRNVCMGLLTGASAFSATQALAVTPESPASIVIAGGLIPDLSQALVPFIGANGIVVGGPSTVDSGGAVGDQAGGTAGITGSGGIANQVAGPSGLNLIGQEGANGTGDALVLGLLGNCGALRGGGACDGGSGLLVLPGFGSIPFVGGGADGALSGIPVLGPILAPIAGNFLGLVPIIGGGNPDDVIGSFLSLIPVVGGSDPTSALGIIPVAGPVLTSLLSGGLPIGAVPLDLLGGNAFAAGSLLSGGVPVVGGLLDGGLGGGILGGGIVGADGLIGGLIGGLL